MEIKSHFCIDESHSKCSELKCSTEGCNNNPGGLIVTEEDEILFCLEHSPYGSDKIECSIFDPNKYNSSDLKIYSWVINLRDKFNEN